MRVSAEDLLHHNFKVEANPLKVLPVLLHVDDFNDFDYDEGKFKNLQWDDLMSFLGEEVNEFILDQYLS